MLDFYNINVDLVKKNTYEICPTFKVIGHSKDLMTRGRDFYAIWDENTGLWSKDEDTVIRMIDAELYSKKQEVLEKYGTDVYVKVRTMEDARSGMIDIWHKYVQKQLRDSYKELDEKLTFANTETKKSDYVSRKLPYSLAEGSYEAWDEIVGTLYSPEEREKIEWAIGSIISGDSKKIQKFMVFYGEGGTGKSTILNIIEKLFDGYYNRFFSKELTGSNNGFALASFKMNPLVSIEHDGDLSRIEDNTKLNSIVSHESMEINEKYKPQYVARFNSFIFMGTNKPVKITEARSGVIRRLIDVHPTGNKIPRRRYDKLMGQIDFELGAIAWHCLQVYEERGKSFYDDYIPKDMISSTNDFYDFMETYYDRWLEADGTPLKVAWALYFDDYCAYANVLHKLPLRAFRVELANYFNEVKERYVLDGERYTNYYLGFKWKKFPGHEGPSSISDESKEDGPYGIRKDEDGNWIIFKDVHEIEGGSAFDLGYEGQLAQYAKKDGSPRQFWIDVTTKLVDIDTSKLHYVLLPENHIVIDLDLKNSGGEKDLMLNLKAASKFPKTYAEVSKSGKAIHLHYIYDGDSKELSHIYDDDIEIKTFGGKGGLRRKLTLCNDLPIAHISSGLPLKGVKHIVVDMNVVNLEKSLVTTIKKCLAKEVHSNTTSNVDFIKKILDDAYASGKPYDVSNMQQSVMNFALHSTHQAEKCLKTVSKMKWKSEVEREEKPIGLFEGASEKDLLPEGACSDINGLPIIFYDIEVFPNLFVVCYKLHGVDGVTKLINPTPAQLDPLVMSGRLVGFNNRRYDNHVLYARWARNYTNEQLYHISDNLINGDEKDKQKAQFSNAFGLSYTDVWDFASNKQGLKKWEIELGIYHVENEHPWDQPVDKKYWNEVADYCANDVIATEVVFDHLKEDWKARQILADLGNGSVNETTNTLTQKIVFGNNPKPKLVYTNLATGEQSIGR